jgi:hypothetical protein
VILAARLGRAQRSESNVVPHAFLLAVRRVVGPVEIGQEAAWRSGLCPVLLEGSALAAVGIMSRQGGPDLRGSPTGGTC